MQKRGYLCALPDIKCPHSLWAIELMGRHSQEVNAKLIHVYWNMPHCLYRIGVEIDSLLPGNFGYLSYRLYGSHLVFSMHDRNQDGLVGDGSSAQFRILGLVNYPDNSWGAWAKVEVVAAEHAFLSTPNAI